MISGALISFLLSAGTVPPGKRMLIGYFYAVSTVLTTLTVHRVFSSKLNIFPPAQQWMLRTFLYAMAVAGAFIVGFIFQTLVLLPPQALKGLFAEQLWKGLVALASIPFTRNPVSGLVLQEVRTMLVTFFSVIFLIGMVSLLGSYVEVRWKETRHRQAIQQAELIARRAQMDPHFLFNSLNTIISLMRSDPRQAEQLLVQLSQLFRYLFQNAPGETVPLQQEIDFARQYAALLQARFGALLCVEWQVKVAAETIRVPGVLIQPLIENAIQHGWVERSQALHITVAIVPAGRGIQITVSDDGGGIPSRRLRQLPLENHALENIQSRLQLLYGRKNLLHIASEAGSGTRVTITIPEKMP